MRACSRVPPPHDGYWVDSAGYSNRCRECAHSTLSLLLILLGHRQPAGSTCAGSVQVHARTLPHTACIPPHLPSHRMHPSKQPPSCRGGTLERCPAYSMYSGFKKKMLLPCTLGRLPRCFLVGKSASSGTISAISAPAHTSQHMHAKPAGMCTHAGCACAEGQQQWQE